MMERRALMGLLVVAVWLLPTTVFGGTLYNNTTLSGAVTGLTGSDRMIQIDDVLVPPSRDPSRLPLAITSITVDLSAAPGESGQFSIYLFPVKPDGTPGSNPLLLDTAVVTFTGPFQLVTFSSDAGPLVTVSPDFTAQPGFGLFYIGLEATSIPAADWVWVDGPDANLPTAYLDDLTAGQIFLETSPGPPFPPNVSFYMKIDGAPVPAPASIVLLGTALILLRALRYRRSQPQDRQGARPDHSAITPARSG